MLPELGVIEGCFGLPWSHGDRKRVMSRLRERGSAFFHGAPKADTVLRRRWREPHPNRALAALAELPAHGRALGMRFALTLAVAALTGLPHAVHAQAAGKATTFAARVATALRLEGFENVWLLHGGFYECKARAGMAAHARASRKI
jgi:hypothetical protein